MVLIWPIPKPLLTREPRDLETVNLKVFHPDSDQKKGRLCIELTHLSTIVAFQVRSTLLSRIPL